YGVMYFFAAVYAGFQTGYYILFSEMMWLSDFRYASEGASYASVLFTYPMGWWLGIFAMIGIGVLILWKFPKWKLQWAPNILAAVLVLLANRGSVALGTAQPRPAGVDGDAGPHRGAPPWRPRAPPPRAPPPRPTSQRDPGPRTRTTRHGGQPHVRPHDDERRVTAWV
ncbi:hypothetical protein, partial [Cellulosimicrobium funkei]